MKKRLMALANFDLKLIDQSGSALLSIGLVRHGTPAHPPPKVENIQIGLTIDAVQTLHEVFGQVLMQRRAAAKPPAPGMH
jgi:hypothetical protein